MSEVFAKFGALFNALAGRSEIPDARASVYDGILDMAAQAQRFYVPSASRVISRAQIAKGASENGDPNLPYDEVLILDDAVDLGDSIVNGQPLTVLPGDWRALLVCRDPDQGVCVMPFQRCAETTVQLAAFFTRCREDGSLEIRKIENLDLGPVPPAIESNLEDAAVSVFNLCAMLSTANTRTKKLCPKGSLDFARSAVGNRPLYSYHVLVVDGERWDRPERSSRGGAVRSHLRRGHIRRLGERNVWVRATFVRGGTPGFVHKDYTVKVAA